MAERDLQVREVSISRLFESTQRIFGRIDDLPALLDLLAQTVVEVLEEIDPVHAEAAHVVGAAGLLSRSRREGVFRPLRVKGRPNPDELQSFVEHVGPGNSEHPTGLMGWAAARRKVALRKGREWFVSVRDDEKDRWAPLRSASRGEVEEMQHASISAYPSLQSQLAVPILDPEIRGQARPRDVMGVLNVESDELLCDEFCKFLVAFGGSVGYPLTAALRMRDIRRLCERLSLSLSRSTLARALLSATLAYLPGRVRRGLVAIRDFRSEHRHVVEAMTTDSLEGDLLEAYRSRQLAFGPSDGLWGQTIRTREMQYVPDVPRAPREVHRPLWKDSQSVLVIPLVSGDGKDCLGFIGLESGETSYAFSMQDKGYFRTAAAMATVAVAGIREPALEYAEAVNVPALLQRLKRQSCAELPEDQVVRVNAICRALIKHGFVFQQAAEEARLTVHILREYTSRSPRVIDVAALRTLAARREENLRVASVAQTWEVREVS